MVNKKYCMSSYLAFRYINDINMNFYPKMKHNAMKLLPDDQKTLVCSADDIDIAIKKKFDEISNEKIGLLLSGGMDSAILASYMRGCDAYTFRFMGGKYQKEELQRAERFAEYYNLKLHYVDIEWNAVIDTIDRIMINKAAPVHSIEPQIMLAAIQAKADGITTMIIGNASDYVFGGMDQLLSKDWKYKEFIERYCYINPSDVLNEAVDISGAFEKYRCGDKIDYLGFMDEVAIEESYNSYFNAFETAGLKYIDPYMHLKMGVSLDLNRIRGGESKYLIRELFSIKYPDIPTPNKNPMPRPVDYYFSKWEGPKRSEFKPNLDMSKFSGNQKWQLWCLQYFLNMFEEQ